MYNDYFFINKDYFFDNILFPPFLYLKESEDIVNDYPNKERNINNENNKISKEENLLANTGFNSNIQKSLFYFPSSKNCLPKVITLDFINTENKNENTEFIEKERNSSNCNIIESIKKKKGRKAKNLNEASGHNKYTDDNIMKRIVNLLKKHLREFINSEIKKIDNDDKNQNQRQLLKPTQTNKNIDYIKKLTYQTLQEIFSIKISYKFKKNYETKSQDNKKLIEKLINEKDLEKRKKFSNLFNLRFIDCLFHFEGSKEISELKGMIKIDKCLSNLNEDTEYKEKFKYFCKNFEYILKKKKSRKKKIKNNKSIH